MNNIEAIDNINNRKKTVISHVLLWILYLVLQLWWRFDSYGIYTLIGAFLQVLSWAMIFYAARLYLYPRYLWKNHYVLALNLLLLYILFQIFTIGYADFLISLEKSSTIDILKHIKRGTFWFFNMSFLAFGFTYYDELGKEKARRLEIETKLQKTEIELKNAQLDNLKAQFNPHFLFNTLWYIYALVQDTGSKDATKAVELLSDMMRYSMKDYAVGSLAPLEDELKYINNYVELQQLRTPMMKLDYQVEGDIKGIKILPLVLMSFVENAFKHGKLNESENPLIIHLTAVQGDYIRFFVQNKISLFGKERSNGIGLENVKKRLQRNYPNKHSLNIINQNQLYSSELIVKIPTHDNLHNS